MTRLRNWWARLLYRLHVRDHCHQVGVTRNGNRYIIGWSRVQTNSLLWSEPADE